MNSPAEPYSPHKFSNGEKVKKRSARWSKVRLSQTPALTFDHSAQQAWDGLDLRHIVQEEVTITCCIGISTLTEDVPQVSGHSHILHHLGLCTCFKIVNPQSSVSHQTDPENGDEESFGVGEALQLSQQLRSGSRDERLAVTRQH